ncbi:MAG: hypothetical protein MJE77_17870 [Proteobacteria bacterium]|nr:hypothetical protein [Pseudomonadota bacterium]
MGPLQQSTLLLEQSQWVATMADVMLVYRPWWAVLADNAVGLTVTVIVVSAIAVALVRLRQRDKCLSLLDGYHVTYLGCHGGSLWGRLVVYSKGLEVVFDAIHTSRNGIEKSSALIYENDLLDCLALCRSVEALSDSEVNRRMRQIRTAFRPGRVRRGGRAVRNLVITLRDAFGKVLGAFLGQLSRESSVRARFLGAQKNQVTELGKVILGAAGNAYEPMLERHVGKPVVLQVKSPVAKDQPIIEIPGFLAEYSDRYIAVFNTVHEPYRDVHLDVSDVSESLEEDGFRIDRNHDRVVVTCTGPEVVVVKSVATETRTMELECALLCGTGVEVPVGRTSRRAMRSEVDTERSGRAAGSSIGSSKSIHVHVRLTRRIDVVCPRQYAAIYFGGTLDVAEKNRGEDDRRKAGVAPEELLER